MVLVERGVLLQVRIAILVCGVCTIAAAQKLIDAATGRQIEESLPANSPLNCDLFKTGPALSYRLQMQFGFVAALPLAQLPVRNPKLWALLRVTARGGGVDEKPVFFLREYDLPRILDPQFVARFSSTVRGGAGEYDVAATVFDEQHRSCREEWKVHVNPTQEEQSVIQPMPAHSVAEVTRGGSPASEPEPAPGLGRLTILLHAASSNARQSVLTDADVRMLTGELGAVMERLPARDVRLVVFNLDWQKEYYRPSGFRPEDIDQVTQVLTSVGPGTVDVPTLASEKTSLDMLAGLLNRELTDPAQPDVILFLGPPGMAYNRAAANAVRAQRKIAPLIFYIEHIGPVYYQQTGGAAVYGIDQMAKTPGGSAGSPTGSITNSAANAQPFPRVQGRAAPGANNEDFNTIRITVAALKGKTLLVQRPLDFAKALQEVVSAVNKRRH